MQGDFRLGQWLVQPSRDVIESRDRSVQLEPKAMDLLVYLAKHQGEVLQKERLIQAVWPDAFVTDEVLTNSIWKLRQALGDDPKSPEFIQTIPRRGYQLIAEVEYEEEAEEEEPRYRIQEKLGQGAMGEVYLAEDTFLRRRVALKFLLEEKEEDEHWHRRLMREARAAAALDHPFICKVYDTGRLDGRTFIAMEYVEGESLKQRLGKGPLPVDEAIQIAGEMAEALEIAHQEGIVHRDIKPSNIVLTRQNHVKVTDFGVAKRIQAVEGQEQEWTATLTEEASTLGTLPYMSPEQIRGQALDARSDLFSLGVVLYEMLTGVHPFRRGLSADTAAAVLTEKTLPLSQFENNFPEALQKVLDRALSKDPEDRYPSTGEMRKDLGSVLRSSLQVRRARPIPFPGKKTVAVLSSLAAIVLLVLFGRSFLSAIWPGDPASIGVLPLDNLNKEADQDSLVDGISEELTMELGKIADFRVISSQSMKQFKGTEKTLSTIVREFVARGGNPVDAFVTGSAVLDGETVRLRVMLNRVQPEAILWNDSYEGTLGGLPVFYGQVASEIARQMQVALTSRVEAEFSEAQEVDPEAYEAFLRAVGGEYSKEGAVRSIEQMKQALDLEPTFPRFWAGLASAYMGADYWFPPEEIYPKARQAAERALELDDSLANAHQALAGVSFWYDWDWDKAEEEYRQTIELNPSGAGAPLSYSRYLVSMGRFEEAVAECKQAIRLDPLAYINDVQLGWTYLMARRYDESIAVFQKILELKPDDELTRLHLTWPYTFQGRYAEAVEELDTLGPDYGASAVWTYALAGQREKAEAIMEKLLSSEYFDPVHLAWAYGCLGDTERAFESLEKAYDQHNPYMVLLNVDPGLDPLRDDPRYTDLLRRVGFEVE